MLEVHTRSRMRSPLTQFRWEDRHWTLGQRKHNSSSAGGCVRLPSTAIPQDCRSSQPPSGEHLVCFARLYFVPAAALTGTLYDSSMATPASEHLPDPAQRLSVSTIAAASSPRRLAAACDECDALAGRLML